MKVKSRNVLIIDDHAVSSNLLSISLQNEGYTVKTANSGMKGIGLLQAEPFDLVLLDLAMPGMDGYQVLEYVKNDTTLRHIPVIVISATDDMKSIVRCIEMGAVDYLPKPFNPVLLNARINASLASKQLHDMEVVYLNRIQEEQERSEELLLNILPQPIAEQLKQGQSTIVEQFPDASVLFADIVGFTNFTVNNTPENMLNLLNIIFLAFDELAEKHDLEKIKTIGDAYMVAGGLPTPRSDHAESVAQMALDMQVAIEKLAQQEGQPMQIRIGMHCGPVIAGVIGAKKFTYDLWGDTVNTASRMESHGVAGAINVSVAVYQRLKDKFTFEERGTVEVKGKGEMQMYLLIGGKTG